MYEAVFRNIDDTLWKDAGCSSELDYIEQTSWILFLKYLDDYEADKETAAILNGTTYSRIIENEYRWNEWAAPKKADGTLDINKALTGDDLRDWVNDKLFPHLASFKAVADSPKSIQYKIGEIFSELRNKIQSGYALREVVNKVDDLKFLSNEDKHELSSLYEDKIGNMGNAGRNGGEYYTPRPLIQAIVEVVNPLVGESVYDGAVGSAGFLCEAYAHMRRSKELSAAEFDLLQSETFFGKEKKSLAYVIGSMNMILHGVESPNITHTNTLTENISDIQDKERMDVVLANPPFGGKERTEIQQNFPIQTSETAYLFLQHFIKILKAGGRGGVVIKSTFLTAADTASVSLRKELMEECNLHTVLILPKGIFTKTPATTVVLFFNKGEATGNIWFYKLSRKTPFGQKNPLSANDLEGFINGTKTRELTDNSWTVDAKELEPTSMRLPIKHPDHSYSEEVTPSGELYEALSDVAKEAQTLFEKMGTKI